MFKFEVGETYLSSHDLKTYEVMKRTEKTIIIRDKSGLVYRKRINKKYSDILEAECFFMANHSLITLITATKRS